MRGCHKNGHERDSASLPCQTRPDYSVSPLLPWQPRFDTLAYIRFVYINKFFARHENLFYRRYSLEKKQRLITNVNLEKMISACVLISIIKLRL